MTFEEYVTDLPDIARYWQAQVDAERGFKREHKACEAPWFCEACELPVCPRCAPSPAEFTTCSDCYWTEDSA